MDSEVTLTECRNSLMHHHYSSWKFKTSCWTSPYVKTPAFSPIPDSDVAFHFELWYEEISVNSENVYTYKINFWKSCGVTIPRTMKMNIKVTLDYSSTDEIFRQYKKDNINVKNMSTVTVAIDCFKDYINDDTTNKHRSVQNVFKSGLTLKCHLVFYDHLSTPATYYKDMRSLINLQEFAYDFNYLRQQSQSALPESANQLIDVEIKIGDKRFFAHKSVLAAHSAVFQKSFLESKTDVISVSDFSVETFRFFLDYLYSGKIGDVSWKLVKDLYAFADKYEVITLKVACSEISLKYLSVDTVCEILKMAYDYEDDYLKLEGKKLAFEHIKELLPSSDWKEMIQYDPLIGYEVMMKYVPNSD